MKVAIAGGNAESRYLAEILAENGHTAVIINDNKYFCDKLAAKNNKLMVIIGDPRNLSVLIAAEIEKFDLIISLCERDEDNLSICQMGKKKLGIEKNACVTADPKNVKLFLTLGVDNVINSAYFLGNMLRKDGLSEDIIRMLPIEDGGLTLNDIRLNKESPAANKLVREIRDFPDNSLISCVIRGSETIVPDGDTKLMPGDRLIVISVYEASKACLFALSGRQ